MRNLTGSSVLFLALVGSFAAACGGTAGDSGDEACASHALAGVVRAVSATGESLPPFQFNAEFPWMGQPLALPSPGCSCVHGIGGTPTNPAGTVSLESPTGATLSSLTTNYTMPSQPWTLGTALEVSATGSDKVNAFSGTLRTALQPSGLTPSLGKTRLSIPADQDFKLSWAPGDSPGDLMVVTIAESDSSCTCAARDSAGSVTFGSSSLMELAPETSATILVTRMTTSTACSGDATPIALVGEATVSGSVKLE